MTQALNYPEIELLIGGAWLRPSDSIPVCNPATETVLGSVPAISKSQLDDVVDAASNGFKVWRRTSAAKRAEIILRAVQLIRQRIETIATVATLEQGKPIQQSRLETLRACDIMEWDAMEGRRQYGRVIPSEPDMRNTVLREPIGVVAAFSPWNFPINAPSRKIGGALASGCSVILKASEETPGSAYLLAKAFQDAGLPPGVLNLVFGDPAEISSHLIREPAVRLITLTGSVPVGRHLASLAGQYMKPAIMELGGHAPVIVCADADPISAAAISVAGKTRNAGQVCVAPTRFFVEAPIYDKFVAEFARLAKGVTIGNGLDEKNAMGPLVNSRRCEAMRAFVADLHGHGANLLAGGTRQRGTGYYFPLTVFSDVPDSAKAMQEEPFGPLALIARIESLDEGIAKANSLPFGLAAYAFTESASNAARLSAEIECGNLSINHTTASYAETPFGGVKDSGYGREGGMEGLQCYTVAKHISHRLN